MQPGPPDGLGVWVGGGGKDDTVGAPGSPTSEPTHCYARGTHSQCYDLHPPPRHQSLESGFAPPCPSKCGCATLGLAAIPRTNGAEQRTLAELGLKICAPVKGEQGESCHPVSPQLGSRETLSYYPRTPPSVRGEAAGLPGRFEDQARPGRLQPSTLRSPVPLPAVARHRHFRQPTRPGLSPRPDHPPWGALTAQRVPPLPPPSPKWRRRPPILLVAFL